MKQDVQVYRPIKPRRSSSLSLWERVRVRGIFSSQPHAPGPAPKVKGGTATNQQAKCYLVLHSEANEQAKMPWQRIDADGKATAETGEIAPSALGELAARYPHDKICLLVPAEAVGLYQVHLPGRHDAAGLRALPWLLEEQLACAIKEVAIVLLGSAGEALWVAVVAQQQLEQWQQPFNAVGIRLDKLVPDALLLPWAAGEITALQWGGRWLLRTGLWQGAQTEANWLPLWVSAWQSTQLQPASLRCYGTVAPEGAQWQITPLEEQPLALLARQVPQAVSLLPRKRSQKKNAWRMPLVAAVVVLALLFCQQGLMWWQLAQQGDALQQQLLQQFRQHFPGQPELHWQATLRRAVQQDDSEGLPAWLAQIPTLPHGVWMQQLQYRATPAQLQLRLEGEPPQLQPVRQLLAERFSVRSEPDGSLMLEPLGAER